MTKQLFVINQYVKKVLECLWCLFHFSLFYKFDQNIPNQALHNQTKPFLLQANIGNDAKSSKFIRALVTALVESQAASKFVIYLLYNLYLSACGSSLACLHP